MFIWLLWSNAKATVPKKEPWWMVFAFLGALLIWAWLKA
jgi:hypothetical protein